MICRSEPFLDDVANNETANDSSDDVCSDLCKDLKHIFTPPSSSVELPPVEVRHWRNYITAANSLQHEKIFAQKENVCYNWRRDSERVSTAKFF